MRILIKPVWYHIAAILIAAVSASQATPVLTLAANPAPTTPVTYTGYYTNTGGVGCATGSVASTVIATLTGTATVTVAGSTTFQATLLNALIASVTGTFSATSTHSATQTVSYSTGVTIPVPPCTIYYVTISSTTQSNTGTLVGFWHTITGTITAYGPQVGGASFGPAGTPSSCTPCGG
jgi:hypothetical protein